LGPSLFTRVEPAGGACIQSETQSDSWNGTISTRGITITVWADAYAFLAPADRVGPLAAEDLDRFAMAALLMGKEEESADLLQRAHNAHLRLGDKEGAARCAIYLAMSLINSGEFAQAGGWLARANRILDDGQRDCIEVGYLLVSAAIESFRAGELDSARAGSHSLSPSRKSPEIWPVEAVMSSAGDRAPSQSRQR
jgi:hypothetical protein